jgi:hypothetical protein
MSNENFISEINEELRSDRLRNFWRRYGSWVIIAMVLLVVGVAGKEGWDWWQGSSSARSSDQFYSALQLADGTDAAAAQKALDDLEKQGSGVYPTLARFRAAALLAKDGKTADAVSAYDAIATAESNKHIRGLAYVLSGLLLVDGGDVAQVEQRVGGLIDGINPMRNAAREALGLVKYKAGDLEGAMKSFSDVVADPLASQELRQRVQVYIAQLVAQGVVDPAVAAAEAAKAAATPVAPAADANTMAPAADATAAPAVGDAPAIDTMAPAAETPAAPAPAN